MMPSIGSAMGCLNEVLHGSLQRVAGFRHLARRVAHTLHFQLCSQFGKDGTGLLPQFRRFFWIASPKDMLCPFTQGPCPLHFDLCLGKDLFTSAEAGVCIVLDTVVGFPIFQTDRTVELAAQDT